MIKIFKLRNESFCVKIVFKFNKELKREEGNQIKKLKSKILKIISKVSLASIK
jgi:hypothetical protein